MDEELARDHGAGVDERSHGHVRAAADGDRAATVRAAEGRNLGVFGLSGIDGDWKLIGVR